MIGLREGYLYFATAAFVVSLVANVSTSFGYLISCASSSISMALSVGPPVIIPFLIFGGFFLNSGSVPSYFTWLSYLSWFRYGNEALTVNQWAGVTDIICTRSNTTCPTSGKIILETLNFDPVKKKLEKFSTFFKGNSFYRQISGGTFFSCAYWLLFSELQLTRALFYALAAKNRQETRHTQKFNYVCSVKAITLFLSKDIIVPVFV